MSNFHLIQQTAISEKTKENGLIGEIKFNWRDEKCTKHKESTCIINQNPNSIKYDWIYPKNVKGVLTHITKHQFSTTEIKYNMFIICMFLIYELSEFLDSTIT